MTNSFKPHLKEEQKYLEKNKPEQLVIRGKPVIIEVLECGHKNNLALKGRESGVCPKGCKEFSSQ